jgi:acyl-CoA reductase-like NAD-dependent aldehyde dehydrogenase
LAREGQLYVGGEWAAPFGGDGASGFGRGLGPDGIDEFLDLEDISMAPMP